MMMTEVNSVRDSRRVRSGDEEDCLWLFRWRLVEDCLGISKSRKLFLLYIACCINLSDQVLFRSFIQLSSFFYRVSNQSLKYNNKYLNHILLFKYLSCIWIFQNNDATFTAAWINFKNFPYWKIIVQLIYKSIQIWYQVLKDKDCSCLFSLLNCLLSFHIITWFRVRNNILTNMLKKVQFTFPTTLKSHW